MRFTSYSLAMLLVVSSLSADDGISIESHNAAQQWVSSSNDQIQGTLSRLDSAGEIHVMADSRIVLVPLSRTDENLCTTSNGKGEFSFSKIQPGTYGLVAHNEAALATYTLHVTSDSSVPAHLNVVAATTTNGLTMRMVRAYGPLGPLTKSQYQLASADSRKSTQARRTMQLTEAGELLGRLSLPRLDAGEQQPMSSMNVMVVRNGDIIARSIVQSDGTFKFAGIKPGHYGMVASGQSGFASFGFEVLEQEKNASIEGDSDVQLVGFGHKKRNQCCPQEICCEVCPAPVMEVVESCVQDQCGSCCGEEIIVEEMIVGEGEVIIEDGMGLGGYGGYGGFGAGYGGGFGGGGGGFGGGAGGGAGGLGGLGGIGALGAAAAVIASENNNGNGRGAFAPIAASPAAP